MPSKPIQLPHRAALTFRQHLMQAGPALIMKPVWGGIACANCGSALLPPHIREPGATPAPSWVPFLAALARYSHGLKKPARPADSNCAAQPFSRSTTCLAPTRSAYLISPPLQYTHAHHNPGQCAALHADSFVAPISRLTCFQNSKISESGLYDSLQLLSATVVVANSPYI